VRRITSVSNRPPPAAAESATRYTEHGRIENRRKFSLTIRTKLIGLLLVVASVLLVLAINARRPACDEGMELVGDTCFLVDTPLR
jgi:hypothetical protein